MAELTDEQKRAIDEQARAASTSGRSEDVVANVTGARMKLGEEPGAFLSEPTSILKQKNITKGLAPRKISASTVSKADQAKLSQVKAPAAQSPAAGYTDDDDSYMAMLQRQQPRSEEEQSVDIAIKREKLAQEGEDTKTRKMATKSLRRRGTTVMSAADQAKASGSGVGPLMGSRLSTNAAGKTQLAMETPGLDNLAPIEPKQRALSPGGAPIPINNSPAVQAVRAENFAKNQDRKIRDIPNRVNAANPQLRVEGIAKMPGVNAVGVRQGSGPMYAAGKNIDAANAQVASAATPNPSRPPTFQAPVAPGAVQPQDSGTAGTNFNFASPPTVAPSADVLAARNPPAGIDPSYNPTQSSQAEGIIAKANAPAPAVPKNYTVGANTRALQPVTTGQLKSAAGSIGRFATAGPRAVLGAAKAGAGQIAAAVSPYTSGQRPLIGGVSQPRIASRSPNRGTLPSGNPITPPLFSPKDRVASLLPGATTRTTTANPRVLVQRAETKNKNPLFSS